MGLLVVGVRLVPDHGTSGTAPPPRSAAMTTGPSVAAAPGPGRRGRAASSQVPFQRPLEVVLPSGVRMPVDVAGTDRHGLLRIPTDVTRAGWWAGSARLGDPYGATVLAAHVDSVTQGRGPVFELLAAHRGQLLRLTAHDLTQRFRIVSATLVPRSRLAEHAATYSSYGARRLVLITCDGPWSPSTGYADNLVVVASPGPLHRIADPASAITALR